MKRSTRTLVLHREAIRQLTGVALGRVHGGSEGPIIETYHPLCFSNSCITCSPACVEPATRIGGTGTVVTVAAPKL